jgi:hypothetical protein
MSPRRSSRRVHARRASRPQIPDEWRHVTSEAVGFAPLEVDADGARADIDITIIASDCGLPARAAAQQPNRPAALDPDGFSTIRTPRSATKASDQVSNERGADTNHSQNGDEHPDTRREEERVQDRTAVGAIALRQSAVSPQDANRCCQGGGSEDPATPWSTPHGVMVTRRPRQVHDKLRKKFAGLRPENARTPTCGLRLASRRQRRSATLVCRGRCRRSSWSSRADRPCGLVVRTRAYDRLMGRLSQRSSETTMRSPARAACVPSSAHASMKR